MIEIGGQWPASGNDLVFVKSKVTQPDSLGHWGRYGGRFVPETLMAPLEELTAAYESARADESFLARA